MKSALLCPGPSLTRFPGRRGYDLLIGVNRAPIAFACDVWACGDWPLYCKIENDREIQAQVIGSPLWFTAANSAEEVWERHTRWRGEVRTFESIDPGIAGIDWDFFTFTAAIGYAAWRGATTIDVYGADWSGVKDFDGAAGASPENRTGDRWTQERWMFGVMQSELKARGVVLERIAI